ncbi:MAG: imidazoleglycerol-phosphate dehydratase HisB [Acidobacteria bacterium]|nr:imidazoleglycerol-phosphate dehydratase HisB [Acidobacteriota bacterium]
MSGRAARIERKTRETEVMVELNLDGSGKSSVETGIGFLDHMLDLFAHHGSFDLSVSCKGDLHIDPHHSVEDIGICLGQAVAQALGEKRGIARYGFFYLPMDEALARAVIDLSGRSQFVYRVASRDGRMGDLPFELLEEFWRSFCTHGKMNLHIELLYGSNLHHIAEAIFKAVARALWQAARVNPGDDRIPSTKGDLQ